MYLTGICSSSRMAMTTPPLAVPSNFVSTIPVIPAASLNSLAWLTAFCPVVASSTKSTSLSASGNSRSIILEILLSSSIKFFLFCNLPAVSQIIMSSPLALPAAMVSNTTAAGSAPSACLIICTPARSAHTSSCSMAAALKVSAAPKITFLPSFLNLSANLPIVVVLPAPLTPIIKMTEGFVLSCISSPPISMSLTISRMAVLISPASVSFSSLTFCFKRSMIFSAVTTPTSLIIKISSSSS